MPEPKVGGSMTVATFTPVATTDEGPQQLTTADIERGPTIATPAPEPSILHIPSVDIHIMSAITFHALVERLSQIEA